MDASATDQDQLSASRAVGARQLLGLAAYEALRAFEEMAANGAKAPVLEVRVELAKLAAGQLVRFNQVTAELASRTPEVVPAMAPYQDALEAFHTAVEPTDWPEAMLKTSLTAGLISDLADRIAPHIGEQLDGVLGWGAVNPRTADFAAAIVEQWIEEHPDDSGRLALMGRRLAGEMVSQAQRLFTRDADLAALVTGTTTADGSDLEAVSQLLESMVDANTRRLRGMGLGM